MNGPYVIRSIRGRVRVHASLIDEADAERVEARLRRLRGVRRVLANPLTCNVLVEFDPRQIEADTIVARLRLTLPVADSVGHSSPLHRHPVVSNLVEEVARSLFAAGLRTLIALAFA